MGPRLPELFGLVAIESIACYGKASDVFKEATKDLPVTYHDTFAGFHR